MQTLSNNQRWTMLLLVLVMLLAGAIRLYRLVPLQTGLLYAQDADEGVYATTAQLTLQGYLPYRDFFTPMPPVAIYLFMIVLWIFYHPWGSPSGLMALRYASVAYGLLTVLLVYFAGKAVGGKRCGLLAALIIAVDGIVVAQDRRAMLESPSNMFSILSILCYLHAMRQTKVRAKLFKGRQYHLVAGAAFFSVLALLTKGTALVIAFVIALAILVRRRWREGLRFVIALFCAYLLCTLAFLVRCPISYIKQMYLFHLLRPWDGTVHPLARVTEIWNYPWSWTTVRFALAGLAMGLLAGKKMRTWDLWLIVCSWAGLLLLLLLCSRTYWATYFSQLAVPFSILGGSLLNDELEHDEPGPLDRLPVASHRLWPLLQILVLATLFVFGASPILRQYITTKAALEQTKPVYVEICTYINQHLFAGVPILVFEPNYTFLSSHPPAGAHEGSFFVDSYGEMLYRNLGIPDKSINDLFSAWFRQRRVSAQEVFHQQPAQEEVLSIFKHTPYLVFDGRALKQLTPETSTYIRAYSKLLKSAHRAELRMLVAE